MNGKVYEIKVVTGKGIRIYPVRAFSVNDAIYTIAHHKAYGYIVSVIEADGDTFENVVYKAAKKLDVEI